MKEQLEKMQAEIRECQENVEMLIEENKRINEAINKAWGLLFDD